MTRFEDRHRELRGAWAFPPANLTARERRFAGDRGEEALQEFDQRTGLLVDDLVAAVREQHLNPQVLNWKRVTDALAALDEASGRG